MLKKVPATVTSLGIAYKISGRDFNVGIAKENLAESKTNLILQVSKSSYSLLENAATPTHFKKVASHQYKVMHAMDPVSNYVEIVVPNTISMLTSKDIYIFEKTSHKVELINSGALKDTIITSHDVLNIALTASSGVIT